MSRKRKREREKILDLNNHLIFSEKIKVNLETSIILLELKCTLIIEKKLSYIIFVSRFESTCLGLSINNGGIKREI